MAGKIVADTLEHSTAGSIATNYVVSGTIKVFYDSKTTFGTADKSFGVSSSSDVDSGRTGINFTNAFDGAFYVAAGMSFDADGTLFNNQADKISSSCEIRSWGGFNSGGTGANVDTDIEIMIAGDLA